VGARHETETLRLWPMSVPILFAVTSEALVHVVDTWFLARVGPTEVGAVAIADGLLDLGAVLPLAVVDALQIVVARRAGAGQDAEVGKAFDQAMVLLVGLSLALTAALALLAGPLTAAVVSSPGVGAAVTQFVGIASLGLVFSAANFGYGALLTSLGQTRGLIGATVVLVVTNAVLDWMLVLGNAGMPALGVRGSAIGTVLAEAATFVFLTWHVLRAFDRKRYGLFRSFGWNAALARRLAWTSAPVAGQAVVEVARWFVFFLIVERMGEQALAVSSVVYATYAVFCIPTEALSETVCSVSSRLAGEGDAARIGRVVQRLTAGSYLLSLPLVAVAFVAPEAVLAWLATEALDPAAGAAPLRVVCLAMAVVVPGQLWMSALVGTGDTAAAFVVEVVLTAAMLGVAITAALGGMPLAVGWSSLGLAWLAALGLSWGWLRLGYWRRLEV
jgi:MATE family multidrug resistance protein